MRLFVIALLVVACSGSWVPVLYEYDYPKTYEETENNDFLKVMLYTRGVPSGELVLKGSLNITTFNPNHESKILFDMNFLQQPLLNMSNELTDAYLKFHEKNLNVFVVTSTKRFDVYLPETKNMMDMWAKQISQLVHEFYGYGSLLDAIHIVAAGYNSDVAAMTYNYLTPYTLGRITAFNPTNEFAILYNRHAILVDTIFTSNKTSGPYYGTVQFNPNGGGSQPFVEVEENNKETNDVWSYLKAYFYFVESIIKKDSFYAYRAKSWKDYVDGKFNKSSETLMGEYLELSPNLYGHMYLMVNPVPYYGKGKRPNPPTNNNLL